MTESVAESVLLEFPRRWEALLERRQQIMEAYGSGEAYHGNCISGGDRSDPTANKASKLVDLDKEESFLGVVRQWLNSGMDPQDRQLIIYLWRGLSPEQIDRRFSAYGMNFEKRRREMIAGLIRFAGDVRGGRGPACANTQTSSRPAW